MKAKSKYLLLYIFGLLLFLLISVAFTFVEPISFTEFFFILFGFWGVYTILFIALHSYVGGFFSEIF